MGGGSRLMEAPPPPLTGIALNNVKIQAMKYLFICRRQDRNQSYTECENLLQGIHKANNISAQITMISTILITNLLLLDHTGKTVKLQNNTEYKKKKRLQKTEVSGKCKALRRKLCEITG